MLSMEHAQENVIMLCLMVNVMLSNEHSNYKIKAILQYGRDSLELHLQVKTLTISSLQLDYKNLQQVP